MKDYKKKYEDALNATRKFKNDYPSLWNIESNPFKGVFEELEEDINGDKIRKELIHFFKNHVDSVYEEISDNNVVIAWLEKQGEQKTTDKIEPVQHELPNGEDYGIDSLYHAERILEKTLGEVEGYQSDDGILEHKCAIEEVKRLYKQKPTWSEEDEIEIPFGAKDSELIEASYNIPKGFHAEIDGDKVVIKNGEKPTEWSEEDEDMIESLNNCLDELEEVNGWLYTYVNDKDVRLEDIRNWLKSIKDRVQPQPKQEWNEEDERLIEFLIAHFSVCHPYRSFKFDINTYLTIDDIIERIRNLSPQRQWKPSDEQMQALSDAGNSFRPF